MSPPAEPEPTYRTEMKVTQEGISVSVYDLNAPRGSELVTETYYFWSELGLTLHETVTHVDAKRICIDPDGSLTIESLDGM